MSVIFSRGLKTVSEGLPNAGPRSEFQIAGDKRGKPRLSDTS